MIAESVRLKRDQLFHSCFEGYAGPPFEIRLWDGWNARPIGGSPACTIIVRSLQALRSLLIHPSEITLGEAFLTHDIEVEGDLFSVFDVAQYMFHAPKGRWQRIFEACSGAVSELGERVKEGARHSIQRDRASISYHYDQPVAFFEPWLGSSLAYSCGYFESANDSLDAAQTSKLDLICRKLRLEPCERFLDIGCGWGSLILHAAARFGADAHGITISQRQELAAANRIQAASLEQSCDVQLMDYRTAAQKVLPFDKIASVGMYEHVGLRNLPNYFSIVRSLLKPGGVFLNHGIARAAAGVRENATFLDRAVVPFLRNVLQLGRPYHSSFIDKYVFPDGELVTIAQAVRAAEKAGFEVRDVENLREHYDLTLHRWVEGLRANEARLLQLVSETTYRTWLLYMAGCAAAFRRGDIAVYQMLLSRSDGGRSGLPLRRSDWYCPAA